MSSAHPKPEQVIPESPSDGAERAQATLDSIGDAVACTDRAGNLTFLNPVAERMTGWSWTEAAGRPMDEVFRILDAGTRAVIPNPMEIAAGRDQTVHLRLNAVLLRRDGTEVPIEDSAAPIRDRDGQTDGAVIVFRDVTAARAREREIAYLARHDFLTGLPNRMLLEDRIAQALALAPHRGGRGRRDRGTGPTAAAAEMRRDAGFPAQPADAGRGTGGEMARRTGARLMHAGLVLAVALSTGCTIVHTPAPGAAVELPSLASEAVVLPEPRETITLPPQAPAKSAATTVSTDEKPAFVAKPSSPTDKPREKAPAAAPAPAPVAIASPPKPSPAPAAAPVPAAPLDLDALRARLKETAAIGLMAKIELRSQVDALVDRFRAHHAGGPPSALDALRQSFNALVQKVLTLIREGDPALAAMLASSREAIWGVLEDPVKFNAMK